MLWRIFARYQSSGCHLILFQATDPNVALKKRFSASKQAVQLAEAAFFDPTMTAMQYFPDEHLYAVYAPLFLPVIVPMVGSIVRDLRGVGRRQ